MQKLIILQGIPASGKSTYAKKFVLDNPNYVRICRDDLRRMRGRYWLPDQEEMITEFEDNCGKIALNKYNVIIDAINLNPKTIVKWENLGKSFGAEIEYKMFDTPLKECLKRDMMRPVDQQVGEKVIKDFHAKYIEKKQIAEFKVEKIIQNQNLPKAIIVDLDGTLCIHSSRGPFEYDKCDTDLPNWEIVKLLHAMENHDSRNFIFLSGREDFCREKTLTWLKKYDIWFDNHKTTQPKLLMRKTGDHRKDCIIKKEIFDAEIKDKYYIEFCLDDRDQVVKLWRDMGLTCLQVAEGNF